MANKPDVKSITRDKALLGEGKFVHPHDLAIMNPKAERGIPINSLEELHKMARAAMLKVTQYELQGAMSMTEQRAKRIRALRCDLGYSWRALAAQTHQEWGPAAYWDPPSNQIAGVALCKVAAAMFGEDPDSHPWN